MRGGSHLQLVSLLLILHSSLARACIHRETPVVTHQHGLWTDITASPDCHPNALSRW